MKCSPFDLKDYLFRELSPAQREEVEAHVAACRDCREEMDRLRLTEAALNALRDEEIPRRIAFVSDKVFEPAWWQRLWRSGPALGFASALVLAAAILVHGFTRPAPGAFDETALRARINQELTSAVAEAEARQARKAEELVNAARKEFEFDRQADRIAFAESLERLQKRYNVLYTRAEFGGRP